MFYQVFHLGIIHNTSNTYVEYEIALSLDYSRGCYCCVELACKFIVIIYLLRPCVPVRVSNFGTFLGKCTAFREKKAQNLWYILTVKTETKNQLVLEFRK